jgi:hypothetical protein
VGEPTHVLLAVRQLGTGSVGLEMFIYSNGKFGEYSDAIEQSPP